MSNISKIDIVFPVDTGTTPAQEYALTSKSYAEQALSYSNNASSFSNAAAQSALDALNYASQLQNLDVYKPKGVIDCSLNPNFPIGISGDYYIVSVDGKIGGASGLEVKSSDLIMCLENAISGNYETVGSYWIHITNNVNGLVIGPSVSQVDYIPSFNSTNGKLLKDSNISVDDLNKLVNLIHNTTSTTPLSAKGDLLVLDESNNLTRIGVGEDNCVLISDSSQPNGIKWGTYSSSDGASKWTNLTITTDYSSTPLSTSSITMNSDKTSIIFPGISLRYKISDVYYYGICSSISTSAMNIGGEPISGTIQELSYGLIPPIEWVILIPDYWGDAADTSLILNDLLINLKWRNIPSKLVKFLAQSRVIDSGTNKERINVRIGDTTTDYVSTSNSNNGLELTSAATLYETVVDIESSKNSLSYGSTIELKVQGNGSNKDSADLQITLIFVVK